KASRIMTGRSDFGTPSSAMPDPVQRTRATPTKAHTCAEFIGGFSFHWASVVHLKSDDVRVPAIFPTQLVGESVARGTKCVRHNNLARRAEGPKVYSPG